MPANAALLAYCTPNSGLKIATSNQPSLGSMSMDINCVHTCWDTYTYGDTYIRLLENLGFYRLMTHV